MPFSERQFKMDKALARAEGNSSFGELSGGQQGMTEEDMAMFQKGQQFCKELVKKRQEAHALDNFEKNMNEQHRRALDEAREGKLKGDKQDKKDKKKDKKKKKKSKDKKDKDKKKSKKHKKRDASSDSSGSEDDDDSSEKQKKKKAKKAQE